MEANDTARVVVGVDRTAAAYHALRYATAEARKLGATLVVVRAMGVPTGRAPTDLCASLALTEVSVAFAEALGGPPRDLTIRIVARDGAPGPALVKTADRDTDLLVIGGSVPGRLRRVATTARFCAAHAGCPVVIVPPPAMARAGKNRLRAREVEMFLAAHDEHHASPA